jgi:hypothetical protein
LKARLLRQLANLDLRYVIFLKQEQLGVKGGSHTTSAKRQFQYRLSLPFGTIPGMFTIILLTRESVKNGLT